MKSDKFTSEVLESLKKKITEIVKEAGLERVEVDTIDASDLGIGSPFDDEDFDFAGYIKGIAEAEVPEALRKLRDTPMELVPIPTDPIKASLVTAFNKLHVAVHFPEEGIVEVFDAIKVVAITFMTQNPSKKEQQMFCRFANSIGSLMKDIADTTGKVCRFAGLLEKNGVPIKNSSLTEVN